MSEHAPRPEYPPLTARHKRIFGVALFIAVAFTIALAFARLGLIPWWLVECTKASTACRWAEIGFEWWGIGLLAGLGLIALMAHRLTADRLLLDKP